MSENSTNNRNVRDDEIDLLDLFNRMGRALSRTFKALWKAFLISVVFIIRRWLPLTISLILGIGLSIYALKTTESYYSSDLVLKVNIETADEVIAYINRLHTLCLKSNKEELAASLKIPSEEASNIIDIQAFWIIDRGNDEIPDFVDYTGSHNIYDTINVRMDDRLNIRVRTKEPQKLTGVRSGLQSFVEAEPLFQQRNYLRLKQNNEILARLETDIKQLDSLQRYKYFEETRKFVPGAGGQMVFLQEQRTQLFYNDIFNLYNLKQKREKDRDLYKDIVTVLSEFSIPYERDNSIIYYIKFFVPLALILTLLLLIIIANSERLHRTYNKYR